MNQRIKELHTKATEWALDNYPPPVNTFMWEDLRNEKFAELIVRESMMVTKDYTCNQGWDYSAPVALARHFGVEE